MFIGDGAKLVRDAFELAKEKCKDQEKVSGGVFCKDSSGWLAQLSGLK